MKKTNLIILIIVGLIAFILGYGLNYVLGQKTKTCPETEKPLAKYFDSGMVQKIHTLISGQITEISGYNLTFEKEGKKFTISVNEKTNFDLIVPPQKVGGQATKKTIKFEDIKIGDKFNANARLDENAFLIIDWVTVLPPGY